VQYLARGAEERLREAAGQLEPAELRVVGAYEPAQALADVAAELGAGLIVVGSAHRSEPGHVHPGSVARLLLQAAPCAVAIVPRDWRERGDSERAGPETAGEPRIGRMLVLGSRKDAGPGHVAIDPDGERALRRARQPVIVLPRPADVGTEPHVLTAA
jgi:hypothetical protein